MFCWRDYKMLNCCMSSLSAAQTIRQSWLLLFCGLDEDRVQGVEVASRTALHGAQTPDHHDSSAALTCWRPVRLSKKKPVQTHHRSCNSNPGVCPQRIRSAAAAQVASASGGARRADFIWTGHCSTSPSYMYSPWWSTQRLALRCNGKTVSRI